MSLDQIRPLLVPNREGGRGNDSGHPAASARGHGPRHSPAGVGSFAGEVEELPGSPA